MLIRKKRALLYWQKRALAAERKVRRLQKEEEEVERSGEHEKVELNEFIPPCKRKWEEVRSRRRRGKEEAKVEEDAAQLQGPNRPWGASKAYPQL